MDEKKLTTQEICAAAGRNEKPDGMTPEQELLWFRIRDVYADFRNKKITKELGERRKNQALAEYRQQLDAKAFDRRMYEHNARMWRDIEMASINYHKERTLENADAFVEAVYGVKRKIDAPAPEKEGAA